MFLKKWLLQQGWRWIEMSNSSSPQVKRPSLWQLCWCVASHHKLKDYSKNLRNKASLLKTKLTWRSKKELVKKVHSTFCSQKHCQILGTNLKKSLKEQLRKDCAKYQRKLSALSWQKFFEKTHLSINTTDWSALILRNLGLNFWQHMVSISMSWRISTTMGEFVSKES